MKRPHLSSPADLFPRGVGWGVGCKCLYVCVFGWRGCVMCVNTYVCVSSLEVRVLWGSWEEFCLRVCV